MLSRLPSTLSGPATFPEGTGFQDITAVVVQEGTDILVMEHVLREPFERDGSIVDMLEDSFDPEPLLQQSGYSLSLILVDDDMLCLLAALPTICTGRLKPIMDLLDVISILRSRIVSSNDVPDELPSRHLQA